MVPQKVLLVRLLGVVLWILAGEARAQTIPADRPRARPPSELTGWADWERAKEIFSKVTIPPAPPLAPEEAMKTFKVAPGYRLELVAAEPLIATPIFFEFDPEGRIWAIEYRGYMRDLDGTGEGDPICRVIVLEDTDSDGRMDRSKVFLDGLVMPRTLAFVEGGVLVAEPPRLWYCRDTNGDLHCDSKVEVGNYGRAGNPQHTANGLAYGIDNWLHSADWDRKHRFIDGALVEEAAVYRGQFGVSFDESGRYVTCRESSPVEMDLIPEEYLRRNPALLKSMERGRNRDRFGVAVQIGRDANECFPIRPTPAITLGALELREDGTLRTYTIVAGTGVYLGDQFPADAYGNIFVPEAGGHLIGRLRVTGNPETRAVRYYPDGQEFLASTDERFRPMSIRTGPDGALYFADMYHGIIEHVIFMAPYIADQIKERNLAAGNDMGRIYRVVSNEKPVSYKKPRLGSASSEELVQTLAHANGWWRITAQRLLVERRDSFVVPLLRKMVSSTADPSLPQTNHLARLHALWTLEGLGALDWETAFAAVDDSHALVRAAAVRLCERVGTATPDLNEASYQSQLFRALQKATEDASDAVRLQAVLSLGALPGSAAGNELVRLAGLPQSPLFHTAILSGLGGREEQFLEAFFSQGNTLGDLEVKGAFLRNFAEMAFDSRKPPLIGRLLAAAGAQLDFTPRLAQAILQGLLAAAPSDLSSVRPITLAHEPALIRALLRSGEPTRRDQAWRLAELFTWPGHAPLHPADGHPQPLSAPQHDLFVHGRELYAQLCAPCHQPHGGGLPNVAPPLNRSEWVAGPPERLIRVVLHGLYGPLQVADTQWNHHMPGFAEVALTNAHSVAAVLTYVRRAWENTADAIDPVLVEGVRAATQDRQLPWTAAELLGAAPMASAATREPERIRPGANGELVLPASKAACFGERLAYRPALDILAPWRKENDVAVWQMDVTNTRKHAVYITLAADATSAGDQFVIETESGRLTGTVPTTGGYDQFHEICVGELQLRPGANRILLKPAGKLRAELADVKQVRLVPLD